MSELFIGTCGFSYHHWQDGVFYPPGLPQSNWLSYYSQRFNSVELNVTFYRLPSEKACINWYEQTPPDFVFAAKGSRYITHLKKLKDAAEPLQSYFRSIEPLAEKLKAILWQLPPSYTADLKALGNFLSQLNKPEYQRFRNAFEFRDKSWFNENTMAILREHDAALCIADPGPLSSRNTSALSVGEITTTDFVYVRFHAGKGPPVLDFSMSELNIWADRISSWLKSGLDVYCYFNNDLEGFATKDAMILHKLTGA